MMDIRKKNTYELAEEMQCVLTKYLKACREQDNVTSQSEYDNVAKVIDEARKDLSLLCIHTQRAITSEDYTKKEMEREDLFAKYANKYFKYGNDEVVLFGSEKTMSFGAVYCNDKKTLQLTSLSSYKKKEFSRTSYREIVGTNQFGKYICDSLVEITEKEFETFLDKKSFQETIENL